MVMIRLFCKKFWAQVWQSLTWFDDDDDGDDNDDGGVDDGVDDDNDGDGSPASEAETN